MLVYEKLHEDDKLLGRKVGMLLIVNELSDTIYRFRIEADPNSVKPHLSTSSDDLRTYYSLTVDSNTNEVILRDTIMRNYNLVEAEKIVRFQCRLFRAAQQFQFIINDYIDEMEDKVNARSYN